MSYEGGNASDACRAVPVFFGGKRDIAAEVWARLGRPKQYSGVATKAEEAIWFSPTCLKPNRPTQLAMFAEEAVA